MPRRDLKLMGEPVLRQRANELPLQPGAPLPEEIRALIADMFDTMYAEEGVGLAAPQVGEGVRVIVVDANEEGSEPFALVNPNILEMGSEVDRAEEGCLSIPGLREVVERPTSVVIEGIDADGNQVRMDVEGFVARILQHEVDHLDGILFLDRVSPLKRRMLLQKWKKVKPEEA